MSSIYRVSGWLSFFAVTLALFVAVPAAGQVSDTTDDPYGRSPKRMFQNENLRRLDQDLKRDREAIDRLSPEQRQRQALTWPSSSPLRREAGRST